MRLPCFLGIMTAVVLVVFSCGPAAGFLLENSNMDAPEDFAFDQGWVRYGDPEPGAAIGQAVPSIWLEAWYPTPHQ